MCSATCLAGLLCRPDGGLRCTWVPSCSPITHPTPPLPCPRRIEKACLSTIAEGKYLTRDLGGKSGTTDFTSAIIGHLQG